MAARSPIFDQVDPDLLAALHGVGDAYAPYRVNYISGFRQGDPRQHGLGHAVDVQLADPKSGEILRNYQDAQTAQAYQAYANQVYQWAQKNNPALAEKLRWGGYFSGGPETYGALDLMHFDVGGGPGGLGMAGGSWEGGFNDLQRDTWGLQDSGGLGSAAATALSNDPQVAFMQKYWPQAVRIGQQTGLDPRLIISQAALESGYGKSAPGNNLFGIKGGTGDPVETTEIINGKPTRVMARFEGYKTPEESFDAYGRFIGGDRYKGVREAKGLEAQVAALGQSGYATDPDYAAKLLKIAQGIPVGGYPGGSAESVPGYKSGGQMPMPSFGDDKQPKSMLSALGEGLAGVQIGGASGGPVGAPAGPPGASIADAEAPATPIAPNAGRQDLAMLMARLNSGKLWI
jgi:Mannosyl-glycoprotein endo-beta-N-acetylglucosaminidase